MARLPTSIPAPARALLDFIYRTETGLARPACYDVIYGHNQGKLKKPLTTMTIGEIVDAGPIWTKRFGSSAAGAAQFMRATLQGLASDYPQDVNGSTVLNGDMQDRLGYALLLRRGYAAFMAGRITRTEFGKRLAMEWASFPVLAPCQGAHRDVHRGQSYYAGDGMNKALVHPLEVEEMLEGIYNMGAGGEVAAELPEDGPVPTPRPTPAPEVPRVPDAPAAPVNVDPEQLDKPLAKSKTVWMWIVTALGSVGSSASAAFSSADWRVQLAMLGIMVLIMVFAVYAIKRRADIAKVYRAIKAEVSE
ncbi:MAG: hypothetical protein ACK4PN_08350 [Allorhizobium sp.]